MGWLGRRGGRKSKSGVPSSAVPAAPESMSREGGGASRPGHAKLLSERPRRGRPVAEGGSVAAVHAAMAHGERLDDRTRHRLVMAIEEHVPPVRSGSANTSSPELMAHLVLTRVAKVRGDISLRPTGPYDPSWWDALGQHLLQGNASIVLDIVGAWADTYAHLPGTRWLQEAERAFLDAVAEALHGSQYAVSGREIVRRTDLGGAVLVDEPVAALVVQQPSLRPIDEKLQEALRELGKAAPRTR